MHFNLSCVRLATLDRFLQDLQYPSLIMILEVLRERLWNSANGLSSLHNEQVLRLSDLIVSNLLLLPPLNGEQSRQYFLIDKSRDLPSIKTLVGNCLLQFLHCLEPHLEPTFLPLDV